MIFMDNEFRTPWERILAIETQVQELNVPSWGKRTHKQSLIFGCSSYRQIAYLPNLYLI